MMIIKENIYSIHSIRLLSFTSKEKKYIKFIFNKSYRVNKILLIIDWATTHASPKNEYLLFDHDIRSSIRVIFEMMIKKIYL